MSCTVYRWMHASAAGEEVKYLWLKSISHILLYVGLRIILTVCGSMHLQHERMSSRPCSVASRELEFSLFDERKDREYSVVILWIYPKYLPFIHRFPCLHVIMFVCGFPLMSSMPLSCLTLFCWVQIKFIYLQWMHLRHFDTTNALKGPNKFTSWNWYNS